MSAVALLPRVLLPRPGAVAVRIAIGVLPPAGVLVFAVREGGHPHLILLLLLFMTAQISMAVALAHKSVLAVPGTFVQPGLRAAVAAAQAAWSVSLGAVSAAAVILLTREAGAEPPSPATVFSLGAAVAALFAILVFETPWAFQLPLWFYYAFFLSVPLARASRDGGLDTWLAASWLWLGGVAVALMVLALRLRSRRLHRRLCGTVVLGPEDIVRASRLRAFKASRRRSGEASRGLRWRSELMGRCLARAAAARQIGRSAVSRAWQLTHAGIATSITTRPWVFLLVLAAFAGMVLCGGYYDGRSSGGDLDGWFGALAFSWTAMPLFGVCYAMNSVSAGLVSRRDGFRAELRVLIGMSALTGVLAVALFGLCALLAATLPEIALGGRHYAFTLPRPHAMLLPVTLGPWMALAVARWPRPESQLVAGFMAQGFLVGHALLTLFPGPITWSAWLGLTALAAADAAVRRRRWWRSRDLLL